MMLSPLIYPLMAWIFSLLATAGALWVLRRLQIMDTPNARSNHTYPVPRGGGIGYMLIVLVLSVWAGVLPLPVALAAACLSILSFIDDVRGLPVWVRFPVQLLMVLYGVAFLPALPALLPPWLIYPLLILAWLWYVNLTNFMDGIDGITSLETIAIMAGICLLHVVEPAISQSLTCLATIIAAAILGFYAFNRAPARLFMGDAGSIALGFLTGYMLLSLALQGYVVEAFILPAYYLSDATFTLLKRSARKEKIWQAHAQHAYQQAVKSGRSHRFVVGRICWLNLLLILLALLSLHSMMTAIAALLCAYALSAALMYHFIHAPHSR